MTVRHFRARSSAIFLLPALAGSPVTATELEMCGYTPPSIEAIYLPVVPEAVAPPAAERGIVPLLTADLLIDAQGAVLAFAQVKDPRHARPFAAEAVQQYRCKPALYCEEPSQGMLRHDFNSYLVMQEIKAHNALVLPQPQWTLQPQDRVVLINRFGKPGANGCVIDLGVDATGRIKDVRLAGKRMPGKLISQMADLFPFTPAEADGVAVPCRLQMVIMHLPHSAARAASHQPEHFDDSYFLEHLPRLPPDLVLDHPVRTLAVVVIANGQLRSAYVRASGSPELDIAILNSLRRIPVATEQGNVMWREYEISYQFTPDKEHAELYDEVREIVYMPPRPVHREPPDYPPLARKRGLQGNAVIKMVVTETGSVRDAKVEDATHPDFAEAALAAVKSWRFQPATRNGDPVAVWVRQPIPFMIR